MDYGGAQGGRHSDKLADMVADMAADQKRQIKNKVDVWTKTKLMYAQKRSVLGRSCLMQSVPPTCVSSKVCEFIQNYSCHKDQPK